MTDYRKKQKAQNEALGFDEDGVPIQLDLVDTLAVTPDGRRIMRLVTDTEMGPVTLGSVQIKDSGLNIIDPARDPEGDYFSANDTSVALTGALVDRTFSFNAFHIMIINNELSGGDSVFYSLDNGTTEHELLPGEGIGFDGVNFPKIQLRGAAGGEKYGVEAWR